MGRRCILKRFFKANFIIDPPALIHPGNFLLAFPYLLNLAIPVRNKSNCSVGADETTFDIWIKHRPLVIPVGMLQILYEVINNMRGSIDDNGSVNGIRVGSKGGQNNK